MTTSRNIQGGPQRPSRAGAGPRAVRIAAVVLATAIAGRATAAPITSAADPALQGGVVVDFESATPGTYAAFAGGLTVPTVAGDLNVTGARLQVTSTYAGQYNMTGQYVSSEGYLFRNLIVTFPAPVRAFGFNVGLTSHAWEIHAYDAAGNDVEQTVVPPTLGSNAGDFFGIASSTDIAQAVFVVQLPLPAGPLWAVVDNLTFRTTGTPLGVTRLGHGDGAITSAPLGIDCGATCSASFARGTVVTLQATPAVGSFFGGWGGACAGSTPATTVTVGGPTDCTATFHLVGESADLRLEAESATTHPRAGRRVTYRLSTANRGPATAVGTVLTVAFDGLAGSDLATVTAPRSCAVQGATVTCALGALGPDRRKSLSIGVTPAVPTTLTVQAAARSEAPDPTPADAAVTLTTVVR